MSSPAGASPSQPPPSPSQIPSDEDNRTPFERFEDVLRRVVAVPKTDLDEKRRGRHRTS